MTIKNALLAGVAGAFLTAAPALAQEAPAQDPTAAPPAAAEPAQLTLTPGATVRGPDGPLGQLEGVQSGAEGQELTVRGADGQLRAVPLGGIRQEGADVVVAYTKAEYDVAPPIAGATPPTAPPPASTPPTDPLADPTDPTTMPDPMAPPAGAEPLPSDPQS